MNLKKNQIEQLKLTNLKVEIFLSLIIEIELKILKCNNLFLCLSF